MKAIKRQGILKQMHIRHTNTDIRNYSKTELKLQSMGIEQMVLQDEVDVLDVLDQFKNESNDSRNLNNFFHSSQFTSAERIYA